MRRRAISRATLTALITALALTGCGDDGNGDGTTGAIEETLSRLDDPSQRCELLTDSLLSQTYNALPTQALAKCRRDVSAENVSLEQAEILEIGGDCARVSATDSRQREAIFVLIETADGWRLNEIANAGDADSTQC
jgi:hypothetical protein